MFEQFWTINELKISIREVVTINEWIDDKQNNFNFDKGGKGEIIKFHKIDNINLV